MKHMNIVFFTHPSFISSQSMPRFANMLADGMRKRGHKAELWTAKPRFFNLKVPAALKKWMGYIDQFIVFPIEVRKRLKKCPSDTLFVFTDHALGPWIPLVANWPHVIHCHDFLAQYSALGKIPENPTRWTGRQYQKYIRHGYSKGKNFISVSEKTRNDLHEFLNHTPALSYVVYNGVNPLYKPENKNDAMNKAMRFIGLKQQNGYILHVGGNSWYKNRLGVIKIYNAWKQRFNSTFPLIIVGAPLKDEKKTSLLNINIHFVTGIDDEVLSSLYAGANLLLFPSLAEGFGWPIAEAMASGCPVVTTGISPMTEVGGEAAYYIPRQPLSEDESQVWAIEASNIMEKVIKANDEEIRQTIDKGLANVKRFDLDQAIEKTENIYRVILCQKR